MIPAEVHRLRLGQASSRHGQLDEQVVGHVERLQSASELAEHLYVDVVDGVVAEPETAKPLETGQRVLDEALDSVVGEVELKKWAEFPDVAARLIF